MRRKRRNERSAQAYALIAVWGTLLAARAVFADDRAVLARLLSDPKEQQVVINAASRSTVLLQNPCPSAQLSIEKRYLPYKPATLDDTGRILSGTWKQTVIAEGCGSRRLLNVMVTVQSADTVAAMPLLPGQTHADPLLQQDAVRYAVQSLGTVRGGREANCQVGYVADTEFVEQESTVLPGAKGSSWRELWTLASCTQKMLVPIHFIPDATGTTISAGPGTAIRIVPLTGGPTPVERAGAHW